MKSIFSLLLLTAITAAFAQKETLDHMTFVPPMGWAKEKDESSRSYTKQDAKGGFCKIIVLKSLPGTGKVNKDFDAAWSALVKESLKVQTPPEMQPADKKDGWDVLMGAASIEEEKSKTAVILITASSSLGMQNVLIFTNATQYQTEIGAFLSSVEMKKPSTATPSISNGKARTPQLWLWSGLMNTYDFQKGHTLKHDNKWFALYSNGDCLPYLPEEGFLGFDREPGNESWGKATVSGKKMTLEGKWGRLKLEKISDTQWNGEGSKLQTYFPCKPVDGLTLNGSYSADGRDWTTKKPTAISGPITYITYKKDGSFVDYGCFNDSTVTKPAKGTYFIKNFTIVLQYENGFIKKRSFCGLVGADPFKEDAAYFMSNYLWYKGKV
jgi:hypothetical protein